ncbi:MAG: OsmC family protein [Anaerolineales bacterium]|nr:OsmC family protein [Anaerolineales bacterium]
MGIARVKLIEGKTFLATDAYGHATLLSTGEGPGVSPMQMLLLGVGGCTAIDMVDILTKQRQPLEDLEIEISAERAQDYPMAYTKMHIHYIFYGAGLDPHKVERAIELSVEKYCGAHATLAAGVDITHDHEIRAKVIAAAA